MQEGWLCPRCKKVNAPWVPSCSCNESLNPLRDYYNPTHEWWRDTPTWTTGTPSNVDSGHTTATTTTNIKESE